MRNTFLIVPVVILEQETIYITFFWRNDMVTAWKRASGPSAARTFSALKITLTSYLVVNDIPS